MTWEVGENKQDAMAKMRPPRSDSTANLGFEPKLWPTADKLRSNMDMAEYQHLVSDNGTMSSNQSGEGDIRKAIIEAGLGDCMVALPGRHARRSIGKSSHGRY